MDKPLTEGKRRREMPYEAIVVTKSEGVGTIRLNRPKSMNALEDQLALELAEATYEMEADSDVGAVILTGTEKAFCAGGDLKRISEGFTPLGGYEYIKGFHRWVKSFMNLPKPTIAAVNGFAVGAGFCIAMLCDMIIASENAKFGQAFVNVGLVPDLAGLYTLPRLIGLQRAKELVFTGRMISAKEAYDFGIANRVVTPEELDTEAFKLAKQLADGPRVALRFAKNAMNQSVNLTLDQLLEIEAQAQGQCLQTEDHKIAVNAFFKKEKPIYKGK